jgi:DNA-binding NtrC family response regulator
MRVLVVDDEQNLLMTLAANLELEGFEVHAAASGQQALALFEEHAFDLVLSDIRMPGMNGVDLFRKLRQSKPGVPVVLMTAFALEGLVQEAIGEGAFTVLPKPFEIDHVVAALTRAARSPVVLLVDGDPEQAQGIASALTSRGIRAKVEPSVDAAVEAVAGGDVDICVVDLALSREETAAVMDRLRRAAPSVSLVAVAGRGVSEMLRQAAASGVFACMRKPLNARELLDVIARARSRPTATRKTSASA